MHSSRISEAQPDTNNTKAAVAGNAMMACSSCNVQALSSELFPRQLSRVAMASRHPAPGKNREVAALSTAKERSAKAKPAIRQSGRAPELAKSEQFCGVCWRRSRVPVRSSVEANQCVSSQHDTLDQHHAASCVPNTGTAQNGGTSVASLLARSISPQQREHAAQIHEDLLCERGRRPNPGKKAAKLSQFFTAEDVAASLWRRFQEYYNPRKFVMVEPSAGTGAFLKHMPEGSLGIDLDPQFCGVVQADFLRVDRAWLAAHRDLGRPIAILGNPPFGQGSRLAWQFFNHAASLADVIAFVLPRSVRKAAIENRLAEDFHLVAEWVVPENAFLFQDKPHNVRTVFQIWERRSVQRKLPQVEHSHPDFTFIKPVPTGTPVADKPTLAIRRVGANAGVISDHPAGKSASTHYFVEADPLVVQRLKALDLRHAAANAVSIPSLAKSEIVELYKARLLHRDVDDLAA